MWPTFLQPDLDQKQREQWKIRVKRVEGPTAKGRKTIGKNQSKKGGRGSGVSPNEAGGGGRIKSATTGGDGPDLTA